MEISLTEENYLKAIYNIGVSNGRGDVTTTEISEHLNNKAASVTDMLKKLATKKLIHYRRYKGVLLTPGGRKLAVALVRRHRLWEVFLMRKLNYRWDEVHEIAEQLEHIRSADLVDRLDEFLGRPKVDPHGDPIPDAKGHIHHSKALPLCLAGEKGDYVFTGVTEHSKTFLQHLTSIGLKIGDRIRIREINAFDRSVTVTINKSAPQFLSEKVSLSILVEPA